MKAIEKITASQKDIEQLYMGFIKDPQFCHVSSLGYVYQCYLSLLNSVVTSNNYLVERQRLVELHFLKAPMPLFVHEKYHEVSNLLQEEATSSFSRAKTVLNSITKFIGTVIPKAELSGASVNSFGSFLHDCKNKPLPKNQSASRIFQLYRTYGDDLNRSVNHYRNKFIEHSSTLSWGTLSTSQDQLQIVHQKADAPVYLIRSAEDDLKASRTFLDNILIVTNCNGETTAYVHIYRDPTMSDYVSKDDVMGIPFDRTGVHFSKYGPHYHFFPPTSSSPIPKNVLYTPKIDQHGIIERSPDLFDSTQKLTIFLKEILLALRSYIDS